MYDVIFVRSMQILSMVLGKYQLQYAYFRSRTSLDHTHIYTLLLNISCIKYSTFAVIFVRLMRSISVVFRMLTDCDTRPETTPTSIFIITKYSTY